MRPAAPSGDVTLMFTDIEGYTRFCEENPQYQQALDLHNALIRAAVDAHDGYEVKTVGDSFMLAFSRPLDAAACALAIQRAIEGGPFAEGEALRVRVGMHCGLLESNGGDYFGPPVNRAARIETAGHGGMVLLSEEVALRVEAELPPGASLLDCGLHRLKDLGAGQRLFRLIHPDLPDREYPPLRTLNALPNNFPAQVTSFVGRDREKAELRALLASQKTRLITLTGPGGTGKTRLTMQVAADSSQFYPGGVYMVELASVADVREVPTALALALEIPLSSKDDARTQVMAFLRDRKSLIVLDNFEQVIEAARFVSDLLRSCPSLVCLVTSRQLLQISGEREYSVAPMHLPPLDVSLETCLKYECIRLFAERAQAARPAFALTEETVPAVADICRRLEGIPLAMELTASLVRGMTPMQILPRLQGRLDNVRSSRRDLDPRQRSLRGAIDWSYDLLTEDERQIFSELAVFAGGFFLEDAEAVCTVADAHSLVIELRDKSLLKMTEALGQTRFTMLETLREYACEKLTSEGALTKLEERHARHFLQQAQEWSSTIYGPDATQIRQRMTVDLDNLRAGMDWAERQNEDALISAYGEALYRFLIGSGLYEEVARRLTTAIAACRRIGNNTRLSRLLLQRGMLAFDQACLADAQIFTRESYDLSRQTGDMTRIVPVLNHLGRIAWGLNDFDAARDWFEQGLQLAQLTDQISSEAHLLGNLGILAGDRGEFEQAERYFSDSLALHRRLDDEHGIASSMLHVGDVLMNIGEATRQKERFTEARIKIEEGLSIFRRLDLKHEIALASVRIALALVEEGRVQEAVPRVVESLQIAKQIGDAWSEMYALGVQGHIVGAQGDLEAARRLYLRSFAIAHRIGEHKNPADLLKHYGVLLKEAGHIEQAYRVLLIAQSEYATLHLYGAKIVETHLAHLRSEISEEAFTRLQAQNGPVSIEEVLNIRS